ncbi:hypothetical protein RCL_jg26335.t1 [Rhizophagus clarus]|uniref:Uncharacterized protein n=1 Tax=Rhizophagus clarus TaxID=94130 RepID=A0A8H3QDA4_9GLOM|nr:hypothetical protein RCL_jg26335.t1 [Rhizophagus clarus]
MIILMIRIPSTKTIQAAAANTVTRARQDASINESDAHVIYHEWLRTQEILNDTRWKNYRTDITKLDDEIIPAENVEPEAAYQAYHHVDLSLQGTIITMDHDFVDSNVTIHGVDQFDDVLFTLTVGSLNLMKCIEFHVFLIQIPCIRLSKIKRNHTTSNVDLWCNYRNKI